MPYPADDYEGRPRPGTSFTQRRAELDNLRFVAVRNMSYIFYTEQPDPSQPAKPLVTYNESIAMDRDDVKKKVLMFELQNGLIQPDGTEVQFFETPTASAQPQGAPQMTAPGYPQQPPAGYPQPNSPAHPAPPGPTAPAGYPTAGAPSFNPPPGPGYPQPGMTPPPPPPAPSPAAVAAAGPAYQPVGVGAPPPPPGGPVAGGEPPPAPKGRKRAAPVAGAAVAPPPAAPPPAPNPGYQQPVAMAPPPGPGPGYPPLQPPPQPGFAGPTAGTVGGGAPPFPSPTTPTPAAPPPAQVDLTPLAAAIDRVSGGLAATSKVIDQLVAQNAELRTMLLSTLNVLQWQILTDPQQGLANWLRSNNFDPAKATVVDFLKFLSTHLPR